MIIASLPVSARQRRSKPGSVLVREALANNPDLRTLKDRLYLTIEGDQVKGQISVPLAELGSVPGMSGLKGRYLNGSATLKVSLNDGALDVRVEHRRHRGQERRLSCAHRWPQRRS